MAPATDNPARLHRGAITIAVMLAALMQVIDMTIANVALPHMQGSFGVNLDTIKWVLTSYIVASAVATPLMGWLAERFGRRNILLITVVGFAVSSFWVGASTAMFEIVVARILQGVFGAAFSPLAQAILLDSYPRKQHGRAMALYALCILVGPILGPTLGGYITEYHSWRWCFFINVPIALIALLMIWNFVPRRSHTSWRRFDTIGFIMLSLGIGALQYMLDRGNSENWFASPQIVAAAFAAFTMLWMYPWYASLKRDPFVSLGLFRDRNFTLGIILMLLMGMVLLGTGTLLPPLMQNILDYPALTTGLILAPRGMGAMVASVTTGRLVSRINPRYLIIFGLLLNAWALYAMGHFSTQVDWVHFVWIGVIQGFGLGTVFVPLTTITFSTLPAHLRDGGTPIFNLMRNVGSSIGISIVYTLLTRSTQTNHAQLVEQITPYNPHVLTFLQNTIMPPDASMAFLNAEVNRQAAMISYNNDFLLMALMMLFMVPVAWATRYRLHGSPDKTAA